MGSTKLNSAPRSTAGAGSVGREVGLIGAASGALYVVTYLVQRAIFANTSALGALRVQLLVYLAATIGLFALYARLLSLARGGSLVEHPALVLAFPVVVNLALLFGRPYLSIDLWSYVAEGYHGLTGNPYLVRTADAVRGPLGPELLALGWRPIHSTSAYGPLWLRLATACVRAAPTVWMAALWMKALVVAASLGSAALIWVVLGRIRPERQLLGTLAYLWNPLVIVEVAAEGHNDALMAFFTLAMIALVVVERPAPGVVALALGTLTKAVPIVLLPPALVHLVRTSPDRRRLGLHIALGVALALALAFLAYAPLWVGARTFAGLRANADFAMGSNIYTLSRLLERLGVGHAVAIARALAGLGFALVVVLASARVSDPLGFLRGCGAIAVAFALVATPALWPWYAVLPVALLALDLDARWWRVIVVFPLLERLVAVVDVVQVNGFLSMEAQRLAMGTASGASLLVTAFFVLRGRARSA